MKGGGVQIGQKGKDMTVTVKRDEVLYLGEGKDAESFQKHKI